jgi:hypothetical protein
MTEVKLKWFAKNYEIKLNLHIKKTMQKIVLFLEGEVKKLISRGNRTGNNPSKPGQPPRVRTGTLRANVAGDVFMSGKNVIGAIGVRKGPASKYAPNLEEKGIRDGTTRPFLRPTILRNRVKILRMLS